ncbi:hypothetical protein DL96DRAFT_1242609 [Flagelloscypha sp. PMI_526]|nr:hypothetical protein DL96DRAFT_1242609 [Flagelloscypha sp. PMI_526]
MTSRSPSPDAEVDQLSEGLYDEDDSITCRWTGCNVNYRDLQKLIEHIHSDHIGSHKSAYSCEWESCHRKGISQTSRFALISHVRSHTGEKPFLCPVPECDKSFTRSDALAKHMRLQHDLDPPAPGRGSNRKRKRSTSGSPPRSVSPTAALDQELGISHLKRPLQEDGDPVEEELRLAEQAYLRKKGQNVLPNTPNGQHENGTTEHEDAIDDLPPHLRSRVDPVTRTIDGRPVELVMYIITKAKYRYSVEHNDYLQMELARATRDLEKARREKDHALDDVLRATFGRGEARFVIDDPIPPASLL